MKERGTMKFRMKLLVALCVAVTVCNGVIARGQETMGVTLDRWWHFGDVATSLLIGYLVAYPFLLLVEMRKTVLAQRKELAVAKHYSLAKANY
jgi:hypothetical protein